MDFYTVTAHPHPPHRKRSVTMTNQPEASDLFQLLLDVGVPATLHRNSDLIARSKVKA